MSAPEKMVLQEQPFYAPTFSVTAANFVKVRPVLPKNIFDNTTGTHKQVLFAYGDIYV